MVEERQTVGVQICAVWYFSHWTPVAIKFVYSYLKLHLLIVPPTFLGPCNHRCKTFPPLQKYSIWQQWTRSLLLKMWSMDHQRSCYLGAYKNCRSLKQTRWFSRSSNKFDTRCHIKVGEENHLETCFLASVCPPYHAHPHMPSIHTQ